MLSLLATASVPHRQHTNCEDLECWSVPAEVFADSTVNDKQRLFFLEFGVVAELFVFPAVRTVSAALRFFKWFMLMSPRRMSPFT